MVLRLWDLGAETWSYTSETAQKSFGGGENYTSRLSRLP